MTGFLGAGATFAADLNLLIQTAMGLSLLAGMILARNRRFMAHAICQTSVMLLNLVMIALVMWPSDRPVLRLPGGLGDSYHRVATGHAALGTAAELLGLYIAVVAGTKLVPEWLRFKRWKIWMRTELALWWLVILVGMGTYYVWYIEPPKKTPQRVTADSGSITVRTTNFEFTPIEVTIRVGSTVEWVGDTGRHSIVADDGSFQSEALTSGGRFGHTFTTPGIVAYHCAFHGAAGGKDMSGVAKVVR